MKQFRDAGGKIKLFFCVIKHGNIEKENIREDLILSSTLERVHVYWINA